MQFPCCYQLGPVNFHFHTGIGFVLIIADDISAFSCPEERGMIAPNLSVSLFHYPKVVFFRFLFRSNYMFFGFLHTGCCISVFVAKNVLTVSLSYSYQTGIASLHVPARFSFVPVIADIYAAFSCPLTGWQFCSGSSGLSVFHLTNQHFQFLFL